MTKSQPRFETAAARDVKKKYPSLGSKAVSCFLPFFAASVVLAVPSQAAFLDFSPPAREAALGGNGVALSEGTASLTFNPAGLGAEYRFKVSARYENLFSGIEGDDLSTGNLSAVFPLERGDAFGFSLDHFGADNLQQDRLRLSFGKSFEANSFLRPFRLGVGLSYLRQQFTLLAPLAGVNPQNVSAGAFSIGAGALMDVAPWATFGVSGEDLNQPNLGVVGVDRATPLLRYGIAVKPPVGGDRLVLTLSQSLSGDLWETQGGGEWSFPLLGVSLRAGADPNMGVAGFGWSSDGLTIDYAYQFSWNQGPSIGGVGLPGSHLLEVGFIWENTSRESRVFDDLLFKGGQASRENRWKEAFWYYEQALLLRPSAANALQGRAAALKQYNLQRALAFYQEGTKAETQGYFLEAQRDYEWAVSLAPEVDLYSGARDRLKKSRDQGALGDARVRDLLERSVAQFKKGEREGAIKKIKKAQALYPGDPFLQFVARVFTREKGAEADRMDKNLERLAVEAEIFRSKGRLDLARETWNEMLKRDPANSMARDNLAQNAGDQSAVTLSQGQKERAQALLQKGLKAYANGDVDTAVKDWEEVLQIDPLNVNALNNLTRVRMEEGAEKK